MKNIPSFPPELLDLIFSSLDSEDLWVIAQVSSGFQCLALFLLFATCDLSASQIYSGIVSIPGKASFLVPRIYRIHPIQKLAILHKRPTLRVLTSILSAMPPIPDVTISDAGGLSSHETASVITPLCSAAVDPAVIFFATGRGCGLVFVSPSRLRYPIPFDSLRSLWKPIEHLWRPFLWRNAFNILTFPAAFLAQVIRWSLWNLWVLIGWLYYHMIGPPRDLTTRTDMRWTEGLVRVQTVSVPDGGSLCLVQSGPSRVKWLTFVDHSFITLSLAQHTALMAALPLGAELTGLNLDWNCGISLGSLLSFVRRYPSLRTLEVGEDALLPASLLEGSFIRTGNITILTAPATYIPYLLPALPGVEDLTIRFHNYIYVHSLTFRFNRGLNVALYAHMLPWHAETKTGMEALFHNIRRLGVRDLEITEVDAERLTDWLMRFPGLVRVDVCNFWMATAGPATLAESIAQAIQFARQWEVETFRRR
ncbi:hypothetical protein B0H19DRAFT_1375963 [Mycena capillaripes]|nr:hypothetical protein B0H19DRAFT_1375963 [Mycena capillaripes]